MRENHSRLAFTLMELIFVIVILGIVASMGSEVIAKAYENYIVQRSEHRASIKTQLASNQIANRLRYAMPGTLIRRNGLTGVAEALDAPLVGNSYSVLQWIGVDGDSFETIASDANRFPGWSGFCDVSASDAQVISTPGSNLALTDTIIKNLSHNTKNISSAAIFFPNDGNIAHGISSASGTNITLDVNATRIVERYKLAWSSYALSVENGDLFLYYNFKPSYGTPINGEKKLLMKNITTFKFQGTGRTIRFKICKDEELGDINISSCKEKAVF